MSYIYTDSLTEDRFMTANFYPSDDRDAAADHLRSSEMADTINMQNNQIKNLTTENMVYRKKCDKLTNLIALAGSSLGERAEHLKEMKSSIQKDVGSCNTALNTFQNEILTALQSLPAIHKRQLDEQLHAQQSSHDQQVTVLVDAQQKVESEKSELVQTLDKLRVDYDSLVARLEEKESQREAELKTALEQLTSKHEEELGSVKSAAAASLESTQTELAQQNLRVEQLQMELEYLRKKVEEDSLAADKRLTEQKLESDEKLEQKVKELQCNHQQEMEAFESHLQRNLEEKMNEALTKQQEELNGAHVAEMEVRHKLRVGGFHFVPREIGFLC